MYDVVANDGFFEDKPPRATPSPPVAPGLATQFQALFALQDDFIPLLGSTLELTADLAKRLAVARELYRTLREPAVASGQHLPPVPDVSAWMQSFIEALGDHLTRGSLLFADTP